MSGRWKGFVAVLALFFVLSIEPPTGSKAVQVGGSHQPLECDSLVKKDIRVNLLFMDENGELTKIINTTLDSGVEFLSLLMARSVISGSQVEYASAEEVASTNLGCAYISHFQTCLYLDPDGDFLADYLDVGIFLMLGETETGFARVATERGNPEEGFRVFYIRCEDISCTKEDTDWFRFTRAMKWRGCPIA